MKVQLISYSQPPESTQSIQDLVAYCANGNRNNP